MKKLIQLSLVLGVLFAITACGSSGDLPRLSSNAVILSFGDSLTRGKGAEDNQSYPAVLQNLTKRKVINAGINGEISEQGLDRLPALLDQHSPDLLILCHGGNDILQKRDMNRMGENVRKMISLAEDRNIPVVLLGVPRPGLFLSSADVYEEIAELTGVIFIEDLIPDVLSDKSLKSDVAHPNHAGYQVMAEAIFSVLEDSGAI
ncbi:MAG: arylesterase [Gammaproteobacteria bacterium]|nr:arylesterase [Gammaproteobacteria bacterium]